MLSAIPDVAIRSPSEMIGMNQIGCQGYQLSDFDILVSDGCSIRAQHGSVPNIANQLTYVLHTIKRSKVKHLTQPDARRCGFVWGSYKDTDMHEASPLAKSLAYNLDKNK